MKVVKFYSGERTSIADQIFAACDTPRLVQGDVSAILVGGAASRILRGFVATFANKVVSVSTGAALLALNAGDTQQNGLYVGDDAPGQQVDCSALAAGTYGVFVTFNSVPTDLEERTKYQSGTTGFDQDISVFTRQAAQWRLRVATASPGPEYLQIATVSLPDGAIQDTRPLLFEGRASDRFAPTWGSDADRSAERGANPISDLETMIAALKVAISDVKGAPWYEAVGPSQNGSGDSTAGHGSVYWGDGPPSDTLNPGVDSLFIDQQNLVIYRAS